MIDQNAILSKFYDKRFLEITQIKLQSEIASNQKESKLLSDNSQIDFDEICLKGAISEANQNKIFIPSFYVSLLTHAKKWVMYETLAKLRVGYKCDVMFTQYQRKNDFHGASLDTSALSSLLSSRWHGEKWREIKLFFHIFLCYQVFVKRKTYWEKWASSASYKKKHAAIIFLRTTRKKFLEKRSVNSTVYHFNPNLFGKLNFSGLARRSFFAHSDPCTRKSFRQFS